MPHGEMKIVYDNATDTPEKWLHNCQNNIAIDFDMVVHYAYDGARDGECYGPPMPGAVEAIKAISKEYDIIIHTCKARPNGPIYRFERENRFSQFTGEELVWEWLAEHGLNTHVSEVTAIKPVAVLYLDDKAVRFLNWDQATQDIKTLKSQQA